jgi:hypothetical protein
MVRKRKTADLETVAFGGYCGSKARTIDIQKGEMRIQLHDLNLIGRRRNGPCRGDQNCVLPHQFEYKKEQVGNRRMMNCLYKMTVSIG